MANPGALATLDLDQAIAEIAAGRLMRQIAADYGCSKVAVYKRLRDHPGYRDAINSQADSLVEEALEQVMSCDAATVNIARARFDACHKWAQSRNPDVWGSRPNVAVQINNLGGLEQVLTGDAAELLDRLRGAVEQSPVAEITHAAPHDDGGKL